MKVRLRRTWQQPRTLNRLRADNPATEDGLYEFPATKQMLAELPPDARIIIGNGDRDYIEVREAREDMTLIPGVGGKTAAKEKE